MAYGLQTAIWENRRRTLFIVAALPVVTVAAAYAAFLVPALFAGSSASAPGLAGEISVAAESPLVAAARAAHPFAAGTFAACALWAGISFLFQRRAMFAWTGAKPLERKDNPQIYNIVENLCISRGLPTPKIGILEDDSLNAFATGWKPKDSWIVFSRGLINKLDRREIEAVAAHELSHIMAKDTLLMAAVIVYAGAVLAVGEIILRSARGGKNEKGNGQLMLVGLALYLVGLIVLPLVRLALSRRREYQADAGSVTLTKDRDAMISALRKIDKDARIESIQKSAMADMCIADPFVEPMAFGGDGAPLPRKRGGGLSAMVAGWLSTHPSVEQRVKALEMY